MRSRAKRRQKRYEQFVAPVAEAAKPKPPQPTGYTEARLEPKSDNQRDLIRSIARNDVTIAVGPPGCGKTHIAAAMAVQFMRQDRIDRIYICRPAVVAGKDIGFLPGEIDSKMGPFLTPIMEEFGVYCLPSLLKVWTDTKKLEIVPLNFMRGRTFKNCVIILDEAQNATHKELKMFLTRFGVGATVVITGDLNQSDLPRQLRGGLKNTISKLEGIPGINTIHLEAIDVVRHHLTAIIEERLHEESDE